jgi:hypothetical protein
MVIGVTMVKIIPDHENEIYNALRKRNDIAEVYNLFGEYDLLVILEGQQQADLRHTIKEIRGLSYVMDTWPLLISGDRRLSQVEVAYSKAKQAAS